MLNSYAFDSMFGWIGVVNFVLVFFSFILILRIYIRFRYLLIKPSFMLLAQAHILIQWPLAFYAGYYEKWLPRSLDIYIIVHGFVIIGLFLARYTYVKTSLGVWSRLPAAGALKFDKQIILLVIGSVLIGVAFLCIYLSYVPLKCTGLSALLFYPHIVVVLRELCMKLLADHIPRYVYSILSSSVVYFIFGLSVLVMIIGFRERRWWIVLLMVPLSCFAVAISSLTGTKGNIVKLALLGSSLFLWIERACFSIKSIAIYIFLILLSLSPALFFFVSNSVISQVTADRLTEICLKSINTAPEAVMNLQSFSTSFASEFSQEDFAAINQVDTDKSEFKGLSGFNFTKYFSLISSVGFKATYNQIRAVGYRAFVLPLEVSGWYMHFAQTQGIVGVAGIPKLATCFGCSSINLPNIMGLKYGPLHYRHEVPTGITAGAGFLFSYYVCFGMWSLPIALIFLVIFDIMLYLYRWLPKVIFLLLASSVTVQSTMFLQSDLTTVLITHGVVFSVFFSIVLALSCKLLSKPTFSAL